MRLAHRAALIALVVTIAGCGDKVPSPASTPVPPPAPQAGQSGTTAFTGLHAPIATGQTLVVYNGYDNPMRPVPSAGATPPPETTWCKIGSAHDHCLNQANGLDLVPGNLADPRILAPVSGTIGWPRWEPTKPTLAMACLGITPTGTTLNLNVCHFAAGQMFVNQGERVVVGQVLGLRDPNAWWIHLSLDDRSADPHLPVAFAGEYAIEGVDLPATGSPEPDRYCGTTIPSTTKVATDRPHATASDYATYEPAPPLSCLEASENPTPTPTPMPSPTPPPALGGTWVAPKDGATLESAMLKLSARPTKTLATVEITKVVFKARWDKGDWKPACTANGGEPGKTWKCEADLWSLGASLGRLELDFDVFDDAGDVARSPAGTRTVKLRAPPGAPLRVKFERLCEPDSNPQECPPEGPQVRVSWKAAGGDVSVYRVYWVSVKYYCETPVTFRPPKLIATVGGTRHQVTVTRPYALSVGRFAVEAVNKAGTSEATSTHDFYTFGGDTCGGDRHPLW